MKKSTLSIKKAQPEGLSFDIYRFRLKISITIYRFFRLKNKPKRGAWAYQYNKSFSTTWNTKSYLQYRLFIRLNRAFHRTF